MRVSRLVILDYSLTFWSVGVSRLVTSEANKQASKQLKPNGQMERMVKMTKKDQGQRGMGGGGIHYSHPMENRTWQLSLTACNVTKAGNA